MCTWASSRIGGKSSQLVSVCVCVDLKLILIDSANYSWQCHGSLSSNRQLCVRVCVYYEKHWSESVFYRGGSVLCSITAPLLVTTIPIRTASQRDFSPHLVHVVTQSMCWCAHWDVKRLSERLAKHSCTLTVTLSVYRGQQLHTDTTVVEEVICFFLFCFCFV